MKGKIKILIVEDEVITARFMQIRLGSLGYDVCKPVAKGEEAIVSAEKEKPDLILMDILLAGEIDGIDAAEKILSFCEIPIIFITGYQDEVYMKRAGKLNPAAYLIKPIDIYDIESVIKSL